MSGSVSDSTSLSQRLATYGHALLRHGVAFVTSGAVAAATAVGINAFGLVIPRWVYAVVFIGCGAVVASFRAWLEAQEKIRQLELAVGALRRTAGEKPTGPRLSLKHDPQDPLCDSVEGGERHFRLQILNEGDTRANDVAVVLAELEPPQRELLLQRFPLMKSDMQVFSVSPSLERPAVYVDFLAERPHAGYGHTQILRLKGASWITNAKELRMVVRLEADVETNPLDLIFTFDANRRLRFVRGMTVLKGGLLYSEHRYSE